MCSRKTMEWWRRRIVNVWKKNLPLGLQEWHFLVVFSLALVKLSFLDALSSLSLFSGYFSRNLQIELFFLFLSHWNEPEQRHYVRQQHDLSLLFRMIFLYKFGNILPLCQQYIYVTWRDSLFYNLLLYEDWLVTQTH